MGALCSSDERIADGYQNSDSQYREDAIVGWWADYGATAILAGSRARVWRLLMNIPRLPVCVLSILLANWAWASDELQNHHYVTARIAEYLVASESCRRSALERGAPDHKTIQVMSRFDSAAVQRFLMIRSVLAQRDCEQAELNTLAYAILLLEDAALAKRTNEAISAIRDLAFDPQILVFEREYQNLPENMRATLEALDYFKEPFDDIALRQRQQTDN